MKKDEEPNGKLTAKDVMSSYKAIGDPMHEIPSDLIHNAKATKQFIAFLEGWIKIQEGKYVTSLKGVKNKFKHYLLGYPHISSVKKS